VTLLRNEFGNLSPEFDELEILCQCVDVEYIPHLAFRRRPFHRRQKHSETRFRNL
jgi:hypothetical protein